MVGIAVFIVLSKYFHLSLSVKAGGMRIVQKHQPAAVPEPPQKEDEEEYESSR